MSFFFFVVVFCMRLYEGKIDDYFADSAKKKPCFLFPEKPKVAEHLTHISNTSRCDEKTEEIPLGTSATIANRECRCRCVVLGLFQSAVGRFHPAMGRLQMT